MRAPKTFQEDQRTVALAMVGALTLTIVVLAIALTTASTAPSPPFADRIEAALKLDVLVAIWLAAAIANVARLRFFSERDIAGSTGSESDAVLRAIAVLQNTFEQVVLAVITHLAVAATISRSSQFIAALVGLFAAGRLLFWIGYKAGARGRALGFGLTFYPSVLALLGCLAVNALGWAT